MGNENRAIFETVESRRLLAVISGTAFNDRNNDGVKQSNEKWFSLDGVTPAAITFYADLNGSGGFESATEPSQTLTKEGGYSITVPRVGGVAIRTTYPINTTTQTATAVYAPVISRVILTLDEQLPNTNIPCRKGAVISGTFFTDEDADGTLDSTETRRGQASVFYDVNNDGLLQNEEPFAPVIAPLGTTNFTFQIPVPSGAGVLALSRFESTPVLTVAPIPLNITQGVNQSKNFTIVPEMILTGVIFNDVDLNGKRKREEAIPSIRVWLDFNNNNLQDTDEPTSLSDSAGLYHIVNRKSSATFGVNVRFRSSETNVVTSTALSTFVRFESIQSTKTISFGLAPASIKVHIYEDLDGSLSQTGSEAGLAGVVAYIDANRNNRQDVGEITRTSNSSGDLTFNNLPANAVYLIRLRVSSKFKASTPEFERKLNPFKQLSLISGFKRI